MVIFMPMLAAAHAVGLSQGKYEATGSGLEAELTFNRAELTAAAGDEPVDAWVARQIAVAGCTPEAHSAELGEAVVVHARWACPPETAASLSLDFLAELPAGHRHLAAHQVFHAGERVLTLAAPPRARFGAVVLLGVEHILTGWDHLLFLFGMVLVAARTKAVLKIVTAFTVAHSLTLALGVLGVIAPSPRWVEPLIALSIAWVGVENLLLKNLEGRWRVAFAFGLLHGFGFAGGLADIGASAQQLPTVLLGFNVGVELGQLAVLAVLLPLLAWARSSERVWVFAKPALSALVIVPGLVWFTLRVQG